MTLIAAHRGGADLWPENSPTAFRNTARLPVEFVEFDVHTSRDGALVVHHDATLDRMTDKTGAIADLPLAEVKAAAIRGANGEAPPTLDELIQIFKPTGIDLRLEIKLDARMAHYPAIESRIAAALHAADMLERTLVSAFSLDSLIRFRAAATAGHGLLWLIAPPTFRHIGGIDGAVRNAKALDIPEIVPRVQDVSGDALKAAEAAGLKLGAYAVNDRGAIRRMLDLGVSSFTTDRPDWALAERAKRA